MNFTGDLFSFEELMREFQDKILFGFLEGIWSLDMIYQGQRPSLDYEENDNHDDRDPQEDDTKVASDDQEHYRRDFFDMLEDVINLSDDFPSILIEQQYSTT